MRRRPFFWVNLINIVSKRRFNLLRYSNWSFTQSLTFMFLFLDTLSLFLAFFLSLCLFVSLSLFVCFSLSYFLFSLFLSFSLPFYFSYLFLHFPSPNQRSEQTDRHPGTQLLMFIRYTITASQYGFLAENTFCRRHI